MKATPDVLARLREAARELADLRNSIPETTMYWYGVPIEELSMTDAAIAIARLCAESNRLRAAKGDAPAPANVIPIQPYRAARALRSPPL